MIFHFYFIELAFKFHCCSLILFDISRMFIAIHMIYSNFIEIQACSLYFSNLLFWIRECMILGVYFWDSREQRSRVDNKWYTWSWARVWHEGWTSSVWYDEMESRWMIHFDIKYGPFLEYSVAIDVPQTKTTPTPHRNCEGCARDAFHVLEINLKNNLKIKYYLVN